MALLLISIFFFICYALLIFYYLRGWEKAHLYKPTYAATKVFMSVIVPARNEAGNIGALLDALSRQSFPIENFETIVVDDFSTDETGRIVNRHPLSQLRLIQPASDERSSSKKKAIEAGVKQARGELIITTDADCCPGKEWLQTIHDFYLQSNASFIAAPVKFSYGSNILEIFQAMDFMVLQGITAASVTQDFHTMCNGANLAYRKRSFENVNGFEGIDHVATGDDMLLMHKIRQREPGSLHYLKSKHAIVTTPPMPTWKSFFMQRKRWASKTLVYDDYRIIGVLAFVYLFNCLFLALFIVSFFQPLFWWLTLSYLAIKTTIELPFVRKVADFYDERKLLNYFIYFQPLHIIYTVVIGLVSQFGRYEWKGRKTK